MVGWDSSFSEEGIDLDTVSYGRNVIVFVRFYQWKKFLVCTASFKLFLNISFPFSKEISFFSLYPFLKEMQARPRKSEPFKKINNRKTCH